MRVRYSAILRPHTEELLRSYPLPEPPTEEEMVSELAGLDKLMKALEVK